MFVSKLYTRAGLRPGPRPQGRVRSILLLCDKYAKVDGLFGSDVIKRISMERCVYYDGPAGRGVGVARRAVGLIDKT